VKHMLMKNFLIFLAKSQGFPNFLAILELQEEHLLVSTWDKTNQDRFENSKINPLKFETVSGFCF